MAVKRIGVFGNFGSGNLGNEGSLQAMLLFLREAHPEADLVCICADPDTAAMQHGIKTLPIRAPRSANGGKLSKLFARIRDHIGAFRNIRRLDALLIPGTGILDDFGERPIGFPYSLFLTCLVAKLRGIPVAFVSTGAGPIHHPLSRWLMKSAAGMAAYRSYRDLISKEFMQSIGFDASRDPVYPDLAFRLPDPALAERPNGHAPTIGIGVMAYYGWSGDPEANAAIYQLYMKKLAGFAIWLLNNGYRIRILIGEDSDLSAVRHLTQAIAAETGRQPGEMIGKEPQSLNDLMEEISGLDAVVATRFHNVLCALKTGKPTISLGYARKNDVLMEAMGLGEFCQHVERFDLDLLIRQFNKLMEQRSGYEQIVNANSADLRHQLERQEQFLSNNIL